MNTLFTLNTPCVGICSTVYGDDICRGCKRNSQEVIDWNAYTSQTQEEIFQRLEARQQKVMADKVEIVDVSLLSSLLDSNQIRYRTVSDPLCWAFHLLRVRPNNLMSLDTTGIEVKSPYAQYSLKALFTLIDEELLKISF
jgi:predicted Fe-S protein YdhL (DUF1289 family)